MRKAVYEPLARRRGILMIRGSEMIRNDLRKDCDMRGFRLAPAAALIAGALLLVSWDACSAQGAPPAAGDHMLAIGVVNTTRVLRTMQETKKLDADFRGQNTALSQQQRQKEMDIEELQKHRDQNLKPGSQQWNDETDTIDNKRSELEVWKRVSTVKLERSYKLSLKGIYDHIAAAAEQVAMQQHLDLVIADQTPEIGPDLEAADVRALQAALAARAVLFANKKADITEDVLTAVEANFAKTNPAPGPGPVPLPK
jgi:Skp family chaperone for outer membrane proteins